MDTQKESPERETIYCIVNERHLRKYWPELLKGPRPFVPEERPERIVSGLDCWPLLTWARLSAADCPFDLRLATRARDDAVCLFHWDDAVPRLGVHRCFAVVVQADRPAPGLADMTVVQNGLAGETSTRRRIPLWTQPGLVPRDAARGNRLENVAYFGSDQYEPAFVKTADFREALRARGLRFINRFQGAWHDYRDIDAVLAVRDCPAVVLATKPASKLINAWTAGVPALLGPEPAYDELRRSPVDFLETPTAQSVLDALDRLRNEPGLFEAMAANGLRRAEAFAVPRLTELWMETLAEALRRKRTWKGSPALRYAEWLFHSQKIRLEKHLRGWRD